MAGWRRQEVTRLVTIHTSGQRYSLRMRSLHSVRATFLAPLHPHLRTRLALLCFTRARVRAFGLTLNTSTCACVCVQRRLACSSTVSTTSSLSESASAPPCSGSAARSTRWMCSRRSAGASRRWTRCCGTTGWRRWKRRRRCRARLSSESRTVSCLPRTVVCQGQLSGCLAVWSDNCPGDRVSGCLAVWSDNCPAVRLSGCLDGL